MAASPIIHPFCLYVITVSCMFRLVAFIQGTVMTPDDFKQWLLEMRTAGLARSDAECARMLGVSPNAVVAMKKNGTDRRTDLACRALLHRMKPYGDEQ